MGSSTTSAGTADEAALERRVRSLLEERREMESEAEELVQEIHEQRSELDRLRGRVVELEEARAEAHAGAPPALKQKQKQAVEVLRALGQALLDLPPNDDFDSDKAGFLDQLSAAEGVLAAGVPEAEGAEQAGSQAEGSGEQAADGAEVGTPCTPCTPKGTEYFEVPDFVAAAAPGRTQHCRSINDLMHLLRDVLQDNSELHGEVGVQSRLVAAQARKLQRRSSELRDMQEAQCRSQQQRTPSASPASAAATGTSVSPVRPTALSPAFPEPAQQMQQQQHKHHPFQQQQQQQRHHRPLTPGAGGAGDKVGNDKASPAAAPAAAASSRTKSRSPVPLRRRHAAPLQYSDPSSASFGGAGMHRSRHSALRRR